MSPYYLLRAEPNGQYMPEIQQPVWKRTATPCHHRSEGRPTANLNRELEMDFRLLNRCRNKHPPGLQVLIES